MDYTTIGIDVSKAKLDICFLVSGEVITVSNDKEGFAKLLKRIRRYNVDRIVIEHTGNYQNQNMTKLFNKLNEIVGFGEHTITILLAHLPELGKIERNKIAALCGVAPINHDSGKMRGLRCIQGGRKTVRNALYMATIPAINHNHVIHEYYIKLKAEGKPSKVAIVACMRKLLCYANSLVKNF